MTSYIFLNKKGIEFSFNWIFAIIVGAVLIFLGAYAASKIADQRTDINNAQAAKQLGVLLTPLESSIESDKLTTISFLQDIKLYNDCKSYGTFGSQEISTSLKSSANGDWDSQGVASTFYTKYIFSDKVVEGGKNKYWLVYSRPFGFPFKIADVIYLIQKNKRYCFVSPPLDMEDDLEALSFPNINVTYEISSCAKGAIKVCFTGGGCDTNIDLTTKKIRKNRIEMYYSSLPSMKSDYTLLYAAIFSDPEIYECQVKRLMKRTSQLSSLYVSKSLFLSAKGCSSNLESGLTIFSNATFLTNSSRDLYTLSLAAEQLRRTHDELSCPLF